jgi:hypothetical protein
MNKEDKWIRYQHIPNLEGSGKLRRSLLGKRLTWTIKEDGQNVTIWMRTKKYCKKKQEIVISSHNQEISASDITINVRKCPQYETVLKLLKDFPMYRIVSEFCAKGASITGIKTYVEDKLIIIDIYNTAERKYLPYTQVYQTCYHYGLPVVTLFAVTRHRTLKDLDKWAHYVLEYCDVVKEYGKDEGMVLKTFDEDGEYIMAKVKLDIPLPIKRRRIDDYPPTLPHIPICDIMGAISHVEADFGLDGTPAHDMPLIAKAVSEECRKHFYSGRGNLFMYYKKYMESKKKKENKK